MTNNLLSKAIAQTLSNSGVQITSDTIVASANQIAAGLPSDLLIPALIWAVTQAYQNVPTATSGMVYSGNWGSAGPQFIPTGGGVGPNFSGAIGVDSVTFRQWQFAWQFSQNQWN
jgi:hypothetical protein